MTDKDLGPWVTEHASVGMTLRQHYKIEAIRLVCVKEELERVRTSANRNRRTLQNEVALWIADYADALIAEDRQHEEKKP